MTAVLWLAAAVLATAGLTPAGPLHVPPFDYPPAALKAGEEGRVGYHVVITARGKVGHCRITASSGHVRLDRATCDVLDRATATPAVRNGQPIDDDRDGVMNWKVTAPAMPSPPPTTLPQP